MFKDKTLLELRNSYYQIENKADKTKISENIEQILIDQKDAVINHEKYLKNKLKNMIKNFPTISSILKIICFIDIEKSINENFNIKYESFINALEEINRKVKNSFNLSTQEAEGMRSLYHKSGASWWNRIYYPIKFTKKMKKQRKKYNKYKKAVTSKEFENLKSTYKEFSLTKDLSNEFSYKKNSIEIIEKLNKFIVINKNTMEEVEKNSKKSKTFWRKITKPFKKLRSKINSFFFNTPKKSKKVFNNLANTVGISY